MTDISQNTLNSINGLAAQVTGSQGSSNQLNDRFMTLLVAQMQNQDPMNPLENAELTSQLAQISTVSGIEELNSSIQSMNAQLDAGKTLQASSLIGKGVLTSGNKVYVGAGQVSPIGFETQIPADRLTATITDGAGQIVKYLETSNAPAGQGSMYWDGTMENGAQAPDGTYNITFTASNDGAPIQIEALQYAQVNGVIKSQSGPLLDLGPMMDPVPLDSIKQINQ